ncbi:hypothetical protein [Methylobacterium fujisawaense]|uniref:hypothetical protein n=1 Tax=Methylobacterium fujisawaense TaxID=107400 RepID=UPI00313CD576
MAIRGSSLAGAIIPLGGPAGTPGASTVAGLTDASADLKALNTTRAGQRTALGVDQVTNTADKDKPVSTAQQAALNGKQGTADDASGLPVTPTDAATSSLGAALATRATKQSPTLNTATLTGLTQMASGIASLDRTMTGYVPFAQPNDTVHMGRTTGTISNSNLTFGYIFDFTTTSGASETGYERGKVAVLINNQAAGAASGDAYTLNSVLTSNTGHAGHAINFEVDTNQLGVKGDTQLNNNCFPIKVAEYFAGICNAGAPLSANTFVNLSQDSYKLSRVWAVYNGTVLGPVHEWANNATHGILAYGSYSAHFLDCAQTTIAGYALRMGCGHNIGWVNSSGVKDAGLATNAGGTLIATVPNGLAVAGILSPTSDNAYALGLPSVRFTTVYAVNGTASSSDPSLKTDIDDIPADVAVALVRGLAPKVWRWKCGGADLVEEQVSVSVQDCEVLGGVERPIFDEVPVLGADEKQIVDIVPGSPAVAEVRVPLDPTKPDGETVVFIAAREAVPDREVPRTRPVPRMVEAEEKIATPNYRPGKRTHVGFLYTDVEALVAKLAVDYGICDRSKDPGGGADRLFLRMERFTPLLWRVSQDLLTRADQVEARLVAIEVKLGLVA